MGRQQLRKTMATKQVLHLFLAGPDRELYSAQVAKATGYRHGTTRLILARLHSAGWLSARVAGPSSPGRGSTYYRLTPTGHALAPGYIDGGNR